ncbi:MAG: HD domain-containing protein, partial [Sulfurimonas sp.]|nr:HD domain-containing protein [Sulfurimonas sp.]
MFELKRTKIQQTKSNSSVPKTVKKLDDFYIPIRKHILDINDTINFNIYFYDDLEELSLLLKSGTTISPEDEQKIKNVKQLYVSDSEKHKYDFFLEKHLAKVLKNSSLSIDEKTDLIYQSGSELTQSLFENPSAPENVKRSEKIVAPILHSIIHNEDIIASFIKIIEYDYYTHTHSLNVSIYSLSLGAELNLSEKDLSSLGRAALLHDIGKSE